MAAWFTPWLPRALAKHATVLQHLAGFLGLWLLFCATVATTQFASSTPDSALTQHVPEWCCKVAIAAGPLMAAVAVAACVQRLQQALLLVGVPLRAYWLLLVPAIAAGMLEQWLASSVLVALLGMFWRTGTGVQPLAVAALTRRLLGDRKLHGAEVWSVTGMAVTGLLPLLWVLGPEGLVALGAQLLCSCGSLVLLQALLRQEGATPLGVLVHSKAWALLLVVLRQALAATQQHQQHQSLGFITTHTVDLCYPWLVVHSLLECGMDLLQLVLLRDTGALAVVMVAALASTPYPAIWGIVTAPGPLQRVLCALSIVGVMIGSAVFWVSRWRRYVQARQGFAVGGRPALQAG